MQRRSAAHVGDCDVGVVFHEETRHLHVRLLAGAVQRCSLIAVHSVHIHGAPRPAQSTPNPLTGETKDGKRGLAIQGSHGVMIVTRTLCCSRKVHLCSKEVP